MDHGAGSETACGRQGRWSRFLYGDESMGLQQQLDCFFKFVRDVRYTQQSPTMPSLSPAICLQLSSLSPFASLSNQ
jgi:hypothetical protein